MISVCFGNLIDQLGLMNAWRKILTEVDFLSIIPYKMYLLNQLTCFFVTKIHRKFRFYFPYLNKFKFSSQKPAWYPQNYSFQITQIVKWVHFWRFLQRKSDFHIPYSKNSRQRVQEIFLYFVFCFFKFFHVVNEINEKFTVK